MAAPHTSLAFARSVSRRLAPLVAGMGLLISVGFPLVYLVFEVQDLRRSGEMAAGRAADLFRTLALPDPALWSYHAYRYKDGLAEFQNMPDLLAMRVLDAAGRPINELTFARRGDEAWWRRYAPTAETPIVFNNRLLGSVQVTLSLGGVLTHAGEVLALSVLAGIGLAVLAHQFPVRVVTQLEERLDAQMAGLARATAESERLRQAAEAHSERLDALLRAISLVMGGLDLETTLDRITTVAAQIAGTPYVKVVLLDRRARVLRLAAAAWQPVGPRPDSPLAVDTSLSGIVVSTGETLFVPDCHRDPRNSSRAQDIALGIVTYLGLPIKVRDTVEGVLTFNTTEPRQYSLYELAYLRSFADQAAIAIENARLFTLEQEGRAALEAVRAAAVKIVGELNLGVLLDLVVDCAADLARSGEGALYLWDESAQEFILRAGRHARDAGEQAARSDVERLLRLVKDRSQGFIVNDYATSRWMDASRPDPPAGVSVLVEPLISQDRMVGAILLTRPAGRPAFTERDRETLGLFLATAVIAIENARHFEEVREGRRRLGILSVQLVEAREEESRRIGRELHDEIGQLLTGLHLTLEASTAQHGGGSAAALANAMGMVHELRTRVREMSLSLRPAVLDDLGLVPAALWLLDRYRAQTGVRVTLKHRQVEDKRFPPGVETAAYRILQEALTNVARHASVREATVRIWADADTLGLQVEDRGAGFDPEAALAARSSSGLIGMSERAELLGGRVTIESAAGRGTLLTAEFPIGDSTGRRPPEP